MALQGSLRPLRLLALVWGLWCWRSGTARAASEQRFSVSRKGGACLQGVQRVLGWPTDVCNGQYPGVFNSLVQVGPRPVLEAVPGFMEGSHVQRRKRLLECTANSPSPVPLGATTSTPAVVARQ